MFTDNMLGKLRLISLDRCTFCARCDLKFVLRCGLPRTNGCPVPSRKLLRDTPCNQIIFIPPCHASSKIQATQRMGIVCAAAAVGRHRVCGQPAGFVALTMLRRGQRLVRKCFSDLARVNMETNVPRGS